MKFLDLLRLALARLAVGRVRAVLTMLGVIIGVASVIALVAVGQGASSGITSRLAVARHEPADHPARRAPSPGGTRGARGLGDDADGRRRNGDQGAAGRSRPWSPSCPSQQVVVAGSAEHDDVGRRHDARLPGGPRVHVSGRAPS